MKFSKEKLNQLCALGDEELWREIRKIASGYGINLPDVPPPHGELEKMRAAVKGDEKLNLSEAVRIINNYKRGKG